MDRPKRIMYALAVMLLVSSLALIPLVQRAHAGPPSQLVTNPHNVTGKPVNTVLTYAVNTIDMPTFNSYDIEVRVNGCSPGCTALNPTLITLGSFLPANLILQECINGTCSHGVPSSSDGPGVVHVSIGSSSFATGNGTLFSIQYTVLSMTGGTPLLFQNDAISDPNGFNIPYTAIGGIYGIVHDVAVIGVAVSRDFAYVGIISQPIKVNVTVANMGTAIETFAVNATANATSTHRSLIGAPQTVTNLAPGTNITLTFSWNTTLLVPHSNYTITGYASFVPGETDLISGDNQLTMDGLLNARKCGDVNNDGIVDITDLIGVWAHQFTSSKPNPYDINNDGVVDITDLILTWSHQFT